jgi:hypothetical protein
MPTTVTTQTELDAALTARTSEIWIESEAGVWLTINDSDSSRVEAWDSSSVEARGSSRVEARDSSSVEARDSSRVEARDSSSVEARGSSRVEAWDSSRVEARDSSSVEARGSSRVVAGKYVSVHLHSASVTLSGGVVIDLTELDLTDSATWIEFHRVNVTDGQAALFKAVDQDFVAGQGHRPTSYTVGSTVVADDWEPIRECGNGLHFGAAPTLAKSYYQGSGEPRFLEVSVPVEGLVVLGDKCKARSCTVVREVDLWGRTVDQPAEATA